MGGRGASSGGSMAGSRSPEYRNAYNIEMENASNFEAHFAIESGATKEAIGYQMYVHQDVTGRSLIADTQKEITFLRGELRDASKVGASYGMTKDAIAGMKAGIKEKISMQEKAVAAMQEARAEYEKYKRQATTGNERAKRRGGRWM